MSLFPLCALRGCDQLIAIPVAELFTVHSRFQRTCNLLSNHGEWLTLLVSGMPLPPTGLELSTKDLPDDLQQGSRWYWHLGVLQGPRSEIKLAGCQWQSTKLLSEAKLPPNLLSALSHFLPRFPPEGGFWSQLHGTDRGYLAPVLTRLADWLNGERTELSAALSALLGYGHGLTPSGDDALLGMLFALDWLRHSRRHTLVAELLPLLSRTTEISGAMLVQGAAGHYGERLLQLANCTAPALDLAIAQVADYGHSSGHDMLCGIWFTLALSKNQ